MFIDPAGRSLLVGKPLSDIIKRFLSASATAIPALLIAGIISRRRALVFLISTLGYLAAEIAASPWQSDSARRRRTKGQAMREGNKRAKMQKTARNFVWRETGPFLQ